MKPSIVSVNTGQQREYTHEGKTFRSAIAKSPVDGHVMIRGVNLEGDDQADLENHGGPAQVMYAYAREDLDWWEVEVSQPISPGTFGENLTTSGIDITATVVGTIWQIGDAIVRVTQPRVPCFKLAMVMGDPLFARRFARAHRPGTYLAVEDAGAVAAGSRVQIVDVPDHELTIGQLARAYHGERSLWPRVLATPELEPEWYDRARKMVGSR